MASTLLDTSFLIALADPTEPYHVNAKKYFAYAVENGVTMYLPALAVAEYSRGADLPDMFRLRFLSAPFNQPEAELAGKISNLINKYKPSDDKQRVQVDAMLIAQAEVIGANSLLTGDKRTLAKFSQDAKDAGIITESRVLTLGDPFNGPRLLKPSLHLTLPNPPTPGPRPPVPMM